MEADPQDGWKVLEKAVELSRAGEAFVLATVVWRQGPSSGKEGSRAIVRADGSTFGWIGGACAEPVLFREARTALTDGGSPLSRAERATPSSFSIRILFRGWRRRSKTASRRPSLEPKW